MRLICQAPEKANAVGDAPTKATVAARWVSDNLTNQEARTFYSSLAPLNPDQKAAKLRDEAKKTNVEPCAMAEVWATPPTPAQ